MIKLTFHKSKSIRYKEALRYALFFDRLGHENDMNVLSVSLKEIIEKWEWFNLLFWIVLDWKGTTIGYEGLTYHSHQDKTKIFYSLQQIHQNWMNYTEERLINSYKIVPPKSKLLEIDPDKLTEEQVNHLIEVMKVKNEARKKYEDDMFDIEKRILEGG